MHRTGIEYLTHCWNPACGCSGEGCAVRAVCWAWAMAKRQKPHIRNGKMYGCDLCYRFVPHLHFERFNEPLKRKKSSRIGVAFMGDPFDRYFVTYMAEAIRGIFDVMEKTPWHTYVVLTKQPQAIPPWLKFPPNVWLGVSVNRNCDLWRIIKLRQIVAKVRFVSFEPLYEDIASKCDYDLLSGIDWIIVGGQTRPTLLPETEWVENLAGLAYGSSNHVAVFLKNNLGFENPVQEYPEVKFE